MPFKVKAECVDARNGKRYFPGDTFDPPPDDEQAERLVKAGCLVAARETDAKQKADPADAVRATLNADRDANDPAEAARRQINEGQRTEAGEAEQREADAAASERLGAEARAEAAVPAPKPRAKK